MLLTGELLQLHDYVTNINNPHTHTHTHTHTHDGWHAATSLSASLQHMTSAANECLY